MKLPELRGLTYIPRMMEDSVEVKKTRLLAHDDVNSIKKFIHTSAVLRENIVTTMNENKANHIRMVETFIKKAKPGNDYHEHIRTQMLDDLKTSLNKTNLVVHELLDLIRKLDGE